MFVITEGQNTFATKKKIIKATTIKKYQYVAVILTDESVKIAIII